jgi:Recombinase
MLNREVGAQHTTDSICVLCPYERKVASPGATWKRTVRRCSGWARSAIWQMLRNPIYNGTYYWKRAQ